MIAPPLSLASLAMPPSLAARDYEGYLCTLLLRPREARPHVSALRAFNAETAGIRDAVRGHVAPGALRVQWWRDSVGAMYGDGGLVPPEAVCQSLAAAVREKRLTRRWLDRILDARLSDLESSGHETMDAMELYAASAGSRRYSVW
jgi:phytoene synthase